MSKFSPSELSTYLESKGLLHDCAVTMQWRHGLSDRLVIRIKNIEANFLGLPEYLGESPCEITLMNVLDIEGSLESAQQNVYEASVEIGDDGARVTFRFWPGGVLSASFSDALVVEGGQSLADVAEYTCVLRIEGPTLDAGEVDCALGVRGEHVHVNRPARSSRPAVNLHRWEYPEGDDGSSRIWPSLEDAFRFSLEAMLPVREHLARYVDREDVYWWIGCFHQAPSTVTLLRHDLVDKLKAVGAPIPLDNYYSPPADEGIDDEQIDATGDEIEEPPRHSYRFWIDENGGPRGRYPTQDPRTEPLGEDADFAAGLQHVLEALGRTRGPGMWKRSDPMLVCEHDQYAFDGGPRLSREHLQRLSDLGLGLALIWTWRP